MADDALAALLARLGLASAGSALRDTSLAALSTMLASQGRAALLAYLKAKGVEKLGHRVVIANAVEKAVEFQEAPAPARPCSPPDASEHPNPPSERPYPDWLVGGQVPRVHFSDPQLETYLRASQPVVITGGCPFASGLVGKWTMAHLAEHYGDDGEPLNVHYAPRDELRFSRFYGQGLGRGGVASVRSFRTFSEAAKANEARASDGDPKAR